jgi:SAM-dependent methyltransferase
VAGPRPRVLRDGRACRFCGEELTRTFADLGLSPLANSYVRADAADRGENFLPLHAFVCGACFLVQIGEYESPRSIFEDYAYFSSFSDSWLAHAKRYSESIAERLRLGPKSRVVELASNDGYLLRNFKAMGIPCLGVEPAKNVAKVAVERGVPTVSDFFGAALARRLALEGGRADLLLGNNVLAHVPQLNDFVDGMKILLAPGGTITMEFPHLQRLVESNQFDTIYHEHFSYFSFVAVERVFAKAGLTLFDVDELPTHGGSLRIYARHDGDARPVSEAARALAARERALGFERVEIYDAFAECVCRTKRDLLALLVALKRDGKSIAGYGAPAKGNTLLNYCGIGRDFIDYTVDRSPHKQGTLLPGTRIPVRALEALRETKPDRVLILPWNLKDEVVAQTAFIREWGGRHLVPIPEPAEL